jgi:predicted HTH domain antitoxin
MLRTMIVEYPEALPAIANQSPELFEIEARKAMAVKLYELGRLSSGQAAQLAGIGRVEFLLTCKNMGVASVVWDDNELLKEFQ